MPEHFGLIGIVTGLTAVVKDSKDLSLTAGGFTSLMNRRIVKDVTYDTTF